MKPEDELLRSAVAAAGGVKLKDRAARKAAKLLVVRGLGAISGSRFVARPAGRFVVATWDRSCE